jgi:peptidoglycan hydrolase-like protein with peptidoglycan-binding domain
MGRTRRWLLGGGVTVAIVAAGGTLTQLALARGGSAPPAPRPPATAPVTRQDLAATTTVSGQLGYGPSSEITGQGGTLTWMAGVDTIVGRGQPLYRVDELPVTALYGAVPMYRDLKPGDKGADARQLEENLRALGFTGFDVDSEYTGATARAVERWQKMLGLPQTGTVGRSQVVFVPGAVRIAAWKGWVGGPAAGDVLSYTGGAKMVTADLNAADQSLAPVGRTATVQLPDSTTVTATVTAVGTVATGGSPSPDANSDPPKVKVTLSVADQKALGTLDSTPVDVTLTAERHQGVLTVPVEALLALAEGGYGVQVVDAAGSRIVTVKTGMFANGRVEVSAPDLKPGLTVGVPS